MKNTKESWSLQIQPILPSEPKPCLVFVWMLNCELREIQKQIWEEICFIGWMQFKSPVMSERGSRAVLKVLLNTNKTIVGRSYQDMVLQGPHGPTRLPTVQLALPPRWCNCNLPVREIFQQNTKFGVGWGGIISFFKGLK